MKCIIAGSRSLWNYAVVAEALESCPWAAEISEVVCGEARGVDTLGKQWAEHRSLPVKSFSVTPAEWEAMGKAAGPIRNSTMAGYADAAIVIWDGSSAGSADLIKKMQKLEKPVFVWQVDPE